MFYFKDTHDGFYATESLNVNLPKDFVQITQAEFEEYGLAKTPTPTIAELCEAVRVALQNEIDIKAKALGFSGGNALILYAGFTNPFQIIAQGFAVWEASVWFEAEQYKAQVIAGNQPMLTPEQAVAMMPTYP